MDKYKAHKVVEAAKVTKAKTLEDGDVAMTCDDGEVYTLHSSRARPVKGDLGYVVVYEDGYQSWTPDKPFEEGYSKL